MCNHNALSSDVTEMGIDETAPSPERHGAARPGAITALFVE